MRFASSLVTLVALVTAVTLAAPLQRRVDTTLELLLRQTHRKTEKWHFALVIHAINAPKGKALEHVIDLDNKCLVYDDSREVATSATQSVVQAALHAANHEATNELLSQAVQHIARAVPAATNNQVKNADFHNCFDFTIETVRRLNVAHYISNQDAQKFFDYHTAHAAAVKTKTDEGTRDKCTRANGGACNKSAKSAAHPGQHHAAQKPAKVKFNVPKKAQ